MNELENLKHFLKKFGMCIKMLERNQEKVEPKTFL